MFSRFCYELIYFIRLRACVLNAASHVAAALSMSDVVRLLFLLCMFTTENLFERVVLDSFRLALTDFMLVLLLFLGFFFCISRSVKPVI